LSFLSIAPLRALIDRDLESSRTDTGEGQFPAFTENAGELAVKPPAFLTLLDGIGTGNVGITPAPKDFPLISSLHCAAGGANLGADILSSLSKGAVVRSRKAATFRGLRLCRTGGGGVWW
jgi:hypothetical protein